MLTVRPTRGDRHELEANGPAIPAGSVDGGEEQLFLGRVEGENSSTMRPCGASLKGIPPPGAIIDVNGGVFFH